MLILMALAGLAASAEQLPTDPALERARYDGCVRAVPSHPSQALEFAQGWRIRQGGIPALHCAALAFIELGRHADAARTLEEAADAARAARSPQEADLRGQAGNAWMLAGQADKAAESLRLAIEAAGPFAPKRTAGLRVDRARALVELGRLADARTELDGAIALAPEDQTVHILSAALARRAGDGPRATADLAAAARLGADQPDLLLEQSLEAASRGDLAAAQEFQERLLRLHPGSAASQLLPPPRP